MYDFTRGSGDDREWGAKWRNDNDKVRLIELCGCVIELLGLLEGGRGDVWDQHSDKPAVCQVLPSGPGVC